MKILGVRIETLSPVVLTAEKSSSVLTESQNVFSGSVLRGIFAQQYIRERHLGKQAHADETFRQLFFGGLRFVQANPVRDGERSICVPMTVMKSKEKSAGGKGQKASAELIDLCSRDGAAGYKVMKGLAVVKDFAVEPVTVAKKITFHMSRESDEERLGGHSRDGKVYSYESICEGQVFQGEIIGDEENLSLLMQGLALQDGEFTCRVGRSKSAQYGRCRIAVVPCGEPPLPEFSGSMFLRLDTPLIPDGEASGDGRAAFARIVDMLDSKRKEFSLGKVFAAGEEIDGFVGVWKMRRPRRYGLKAGSVFELQKKGGWSESDKKALTQLMYGGCGVQTEEGFGQLRQWKQGQEYRLREEAAGGKKREKRSVQSEEVRRTARQIVAAIVKEKVRLHAFAAAEEAVQRAKDIDCVHVFSRLEDLLLRSGNTGRKQFSRALGEEVRSGSTFESYLRRIRIGGVGLDEILLKGKEGLPCGTYGQFTADLPGDMLADIGWVRDEKFDDELFGEYWKWFFRHGRKQVGSRRERT